MIIKRKGGTAEPDAVILQDIHSAGNHLREKTVDLLFLLPQEYLKVRDTLPVVPVVVSTPPKNTYEELVLLVRKDSSVRTAGGLRGKRLVVETDQKGALPTMWLEILLMKEGISGDTKGLFGSVKATKKPSQTVLPVFFKQADACIITRNAFETMAELNPQLGRELLSIASSPPLVSSIGVLRQDYYDKHGAYLTGELIRLHEDPQGKQILMLFHKDRLIPYRPEHIASVEAMLREHGDLRMNLARRP
jgi:phosphonate transport system substrate-binding protein